MRDAQLLILDEPTAALDARAEYDVFVRFNALMAGRMAIVISHRFSTVRMADRIIVLENGEIVEQGTHDELVAKGGAVRRAVRDAGGRLSLIRRPARSRSVVSGGSLAAGRRRASRGSSCRRPDAAWSSSSFAFVCCSGVERGERVL